MASAYVKGYGAQGTSYAPLVISFVGSLTVDNHIIVVAMSYPTGKVFAVSDNKTSPTNSYTKHVEQDLTTVRGLVASAKVANGAATVTVTINAGSSEGLISGAIAEVSGLDTTTWYDTGDSESGTGTSVATTAVTPAGASFFAGIMTHDGSTRTLTPGTGWTQIAEDQNASNVPYNAEYKTGSGSTQATWTISASETWHAVVGAFKDASGGGPPPLPNQLSLLGVGK